MLSARETEAANPMAQIDAWPAPIAIQRRCGRVPIVDLRCIAGDGHGEPRHHWPDDDVGLKGFRRGEHGRKPVRPRHLVIVEERDMASPRRGDSGVARMGDSRTRLAYAPERQPRLPREIRNHGLGRARGVVVDHRNFHG
jgi:hypothetical protein